MLSAGVVGQCGWQHITPTRIACINASGSAERLISLLGIFVSRINISADPYGMLGQTHLLDAYVASDITLLAELALYGKFYELPERLSFVLSR